MKKIFEEVRIGNVVLKNRIVRSATWEGIADRNGNINDGAYKIYEELAEGGAGLIINGFTSVMTEDNYFKAMMRLSEDRHIPQYKKLTDTVHKAGCKIFVQLALGGYYDRKKEGINQETYPIEPDDMTVEDIEAVINAFTEASVRAKAAGFDGIQVHAAHFFFLSRFISPLCNHRTDRYGGTTRRRSRILTDILTQIKEEVPGICVTVKINCNDFRAGGLSEDESLKICKILSDSGCDAIEVSGNGTSVPGIKSYVNEAYFRDAAINTAKAVDIPVMLVGGLRSRDVMEDILQKTDIELLSLSRPLIREPDFPEKLRRGEADISKCVSCNACYSTYGHKCIYRF